MFMGAEVIGYPVSVGKQLMSDKQLGVLRTNTLQLYFLTKETGFAETFFTLKTPYSYTVHVQVQIYALCRFSRNSRTLSSILCRSVVPDLTPTGTVGSADRTSVMSLSQVWLSLKLTLVRLLFVKIFSTEFRENLTQFCG
jgi:hypothetical protein